MRFTVVLIVLNIFQFSGRAVAGCGKTQMPSRQSCGKRSFADLLSMTDVSGAVQIGNPVSTASKDDLKFREESLSDSGLRVSGNMTNESEREFMFLLAHALRSTPCRKSAEMFLKEAEDLGLFGRTADWAGGSRNSTFSDLARLFPHVSGQSLKRIVMMRALGSNSQQETSNHHSMRASGDLRPNSCVSNERKRMGNETSIHGLNSQPSILLLDGICKKSKDRCFLGSISRGIRPYNSVKACNEISLLLQRETGCSLSRHPWRPHVYRRFNVCRSVMGHFMAVYCLVWDKTGQVVITGSDDKLIKVWEARTCRLLRTLRGHVNDVADLAVSCDNRFLASAGTDCDIRIWWLHNGFPALVLPGHATLIANILFSPYLTASLSHVLVSTGADGTTRVWSIDSAGRFLGQQVYSTEDSGQPPGIPSPAGPHLSARRPAEVRCSVISPNGLWIACGCSDRLVRIYGIYRLRKPIRLNGHTDAIGHIQFDRTGETLLTGSNDGTVRLWFLNEHLELVKQVVLNLRTGERPLQQQQRTLPIPRVDMATFSLNGRRALTSQSLEKKPKREDLCCGVKVWAVETGELLHVLRAHDQPAYVIVPHPLDARLFATAGYDAKVCFWDLESGELVRSLVIKFPSDDRLSPPDFDARSADILEGHFRPDGSAFALSHKNGFLTMLGCDDWRDAARGSLTEQFFQADFGELIMDGQRNVLDRETQLPPHQLDAGRLCDRFGGVHSDYALRDPLNHYSAFQFLETDRAEALYRAPLAHASLDAFDGGLPSDADADADYGSESQSSSSSFSASGAEDSEERHPWVGERTARDRAAQQQRTERAKRAQQRRMRLMEELERSATGSESEISDSDVLPRKKKVPCRRSPEVARARGPTTKDLETNRLRSRQWLQESRPSSNIDFGYVPQIGDFVMYFHQGHLSQLREYPDTTCDRWPWEVYCDMKTSEFCKIVAITYHFPAPNEGEDCAVFCQLQLQRQPENAQFKAPRASVTGFCVGDRVRAKWKNGYRFPGKIDAVNADGTYAVQYDDGDYEARQAADTIEFQNFVVSFRKTHLPEFVIPMYRYERNKGRGLLGPGDRFQMNFEDEMRAYGGVIVDVRPSDPVHPESEWCRLLVKWDAAERNDGNGDGDVGGAEEVSPWEVTAEGQVDSAPDFSYTLTPDGASTLLKQLHVVSEALSGAPFLACLDLGRYHDYLCHVPLPMDLSTVIRRLEARYYRSREAVVHDLELIVKNWRVYLKQDAPEIPWIRRLHAVVQLISSSAPSTEALRACLTRSEDDCAPAAAESHSEPHPDQNDRWAAAAGSPNKGQPSVATDGGWQGKAVRGLQTIQRLRAAEIRRCAALRSGAEAAVWVSAAARELVGGPAWRLMDYRTVQDNLGMGRYSCMEAFGIEFLLVCCSGLLCTPPKCRQYRGVLRLLADALSLWATLSAPTHASRSGQQVATFDRAAGTDVGDSGAETGGGRGADSESMDLDAPGHAAACRRPASGAYSSGRRSLPVGTPEASAAHPAAGEEGGGDSRRNSRCEGVVGEGLMGLVARLSELDLDGFFQQEVLERDAPDYRRVIPLPMDLGTMRRRCATGSYAGGEAVGLDFVVMCCNALVYNHYAFAYHQAAIRLLTRGLAVLAPFVARLPAIVAATRQTADTDPSQQRCGASWDLGSNDNKEGGDEFEGGEARGAGPDKGSAGDCRSEGDTPVESELAATGRITARGRDRLPRSGAAAVVPECPVGTVLGQPTRRRARRRVDDSDESDGGKRGAAASESTPRAAVAATVTAAVVQAPGSGESAEASGGGEGPRGGPEGGVGDRRSKGAGLRLDGPDAAGGRAGVLRAAAAVSDAGALRADADGRVAKAGVGEEPLLSAGSEEERGWLGKVLRQLRRADTHGWFGAPVTEDVAPGYSSVVRRPMDLGTMRAVLGRGEYDLRPHGFLRDALLVCANAVIYNAPGDEVARAALALARAALAALAPRVPLWDAALAGAAGPAAASIPEAETWLRRLRECDSKGYFGKPVSGRRVPGYHTVILMPMDLSTMATRAAAGLYSTVERLQCDALLVGVNCCVFNAADTPWYAAAVVFLSGVVDTCFPVPIPAPVHTRLPGRAGRSMAAARSGAAVLASGGGAAQVRARRQGRTVGIRIRSGGAVGDNDSEAEVCTEDSDDDEFDPHAERSRGKGDGGMSSSGRSKGRGSKKSEEEESEEESDDVDSEEDSDEEVSEEERGAAMPRRSAGRRSSRAGARRAATSRKRRRSSSEEGGRESRPRLSGKREGLRRSGRSKRERRRYGESEDSDFGSDAG